MNMLYNSDNYTVVQFVVPDEAGPGAAHAAGRGGYEIVDKFARKGIFIQGAVAQSFHDGVQALIEKGPTEEAMDEYIAGYTTLAQQPMHLH